MKRTIFLEHNGVTLYQVCKPGTDRPLTFWYSFHSDPGNPEAFDIRPLGIYPHSIDTTIPIEQAAAIWFDEVKSELRDCLDRGTLNPPTLEVHS